MAKAKVDTNDTKVVVDTTIKAIDLIGKETADQIRAVATAHLEAAQKLAAKLNTLADAIEENTKRAAEDFQAFGEHSTHVLATVQGLHVKLDKVGEPKQPDRLPEAANLVLADV